jgi:NAD(P)-dependent dehydrogenase (short-subunit alcohol dehydrogenase family)
LGFVKKFGSFEADLAIICGPVANCYRPLYGLESLAARASEPSTAAGAGACRLSIGVAIPPGGAGPRDLTKLGTRPSFKQTKGWKPTAKLAELLQKQGVEVMVEMLATKMVVLGLTEQGPDPLFEKVKQRVGRLDVFANCAGPSSRVSRRPRHFITTPFTLIDWGTGSMRITSSSNFGSTATH